MFGRIDSRFCQIRVCDLCGNDKKGENGKKSGGGFTLVEILIVIAIVMMLSTLAINGYLNYRKNALLDYAADDFVAQIEEMRSKTVYADNVADDFEKIKKELEGEVVLPIFQEKPRCYGLSFEKSADGFYDLKSFSEVFNNKKEWILDDWKYIGCDETVVQGWDILFASDAQLKVKELKGVSESSVDFLKLRFLPPKGDLELIEGGDLITDLKQSDFVDLLIQYGEDANYQRRICFNPVSKTAIVLKKDEQCKN